MRWDTGWVQAVEDIAGDWPNPDKDRQRITAKADILYDLVCGRFYGYVLAS